MIIYKATNQINGKCYIGQTVQTLARRRSAHVTGVKHGSNFYFSRAINKYGNNNFVWQILNECYDTDTLNQLERYYIKYYNSTDSDIGYNITSGGKNYETSEETKRKIGESVKAYWASEEGEKKKKLIFHKGENHPHYGKQGKETSRFGVEVSEETRKKMRLAKQNISVETRKRMSNASKRYWQSKQAENRRKK